MEPDPTPVAEDYKPPLNMIQSPSSYSIQTSRVFRSGEPRVSTWGHVGPHGDINGDTFSILHFVWAIPQSRVGDANIRWPEVADRLSAAGAVHLSIIPVHTGRGHWRDCSKYAGVILKETA